MPRYLTVLSGLVVLVVGYFLERGGLFLYFGYALPKIFVGVFAGASFVLGILLFRKHRRLEAISGLLMCLVVLISPWAAERAVTSPRKKFYLLADRVRPGDSITSVKAVLADYRSWSTENGHITFQFSSPGTADVLVVHYDPTTSKVLEAGLSLD